MINVSNTYLDEMPAEDFFTKNLQCSLIFNLGTKTIRKGRLIIFKKSHFFIQISLLTIKGNQETFEVPIPFKVEYHPGENLIYFDYRLKSLTGNNEDLKDLVLHQIKKNTPSQYFNKILEIQTFIPEQT
jgi:hypothetical protein